MATCTTLLGSKSSGQPFLDSFCLNHFSLRKSIKDTNSLTPPREEEEINPNSYLSVVGSLNYLAVATQPDLSFVVGFLAQFFKSPTQRHWMAIQHILGYVKGLGCCSLIIEPKTSDKTIVNRVDAHWGSEFSRSTHGSITTLLGCLILWASKRLALVATSTCHAKFMALG